MYIALENHTILKFTMHREEGFESAHKTIDNIFTLEKYIQTHIDFGKFMQKYMHISRRSNCKLKKVARKPSIEMGTEQW